MSLVLAAMPHATVASGFFRVQMLIVMGLGVLATLAAHTPQAAPVAAPAWIGQTHFILCIALAGLGFVTSVFWTLERRRAAAGLQRDLRLARDEVKTINLTLEERVKTRTADLVMARERAEVLLAEVNHRVANSLQLVGVLVGMQVRSVTDAAAKDALLETQSRINAISLIHKCLYTSGDVTNVALNEYLGAMLSNFETAMKKEGHTAVLKYDLEQISLRTDASVNLGVALQELVTNAFKYAYPADKPGEVRVRLKRLEGGKAELTVEDDGVGIAPNAKSAGTGLGSKIIRSMASALQTQVEYNNRGPGTVARLVFPTANAAELG